MRRLTVCHQRTLHRNRKLLSDHKLWRGECVRSFCVENVALAESLDKELDRVRKVIPPKWAESNGSQEEYAQRDHKLLFDS